MKKFLVPTTFVLVPLILLGSFSLRAAADDENLTPFVNGLASFILPGAGQLLNDEGDKAIQHFLVILGIDAANLLLARTPYVGYYTIYPLSIAHLAWSAYSGYDAYQVAERRGRNIFGSSLEGFGKAPVSPGKEDLWTAEGDVNSSRLLQGHSENGPGLSLAPDRSSGLLREP